MQEELPLKARRVWTGYAGLFLLLLTRKYTAFVIVARVPSTFECAQYHGDIMNTRENGDFPLTLVELYKDSQVLSLQDCSRQADCRPDTVNLISQRTVSPSLSSLATQ